MYYALTNLDAAEQNGTRIAFLDLGKNELLGQVIGMAVYTAPSGAAQDRDLGTCYSSAQGTLVIAPVSSEELLEAYGRAVPTSVFLDGWKLAGSVFLGLLKEELELPIKKLQARAERSA